MLFFWLNTFIIFSGSHENLQNISFLLNISWLNTFNPANFLTSNFKVSLICWPEDWVLPDPALPEGTAGVPRRALVPCLCGSWYDRSWRGWRWHWSADLVFGAVFSASQQSTTLTTGLVSSHVFGSLPKPVFPLLYPLRVFICEATRLHSLRLPPPTVLLFTL